MDATRPRVLGLLPRAVLADPRRHLRRGVVAFVLALRPLGMTAGPASAGAILIEGSTLGFIKLDDDPNRPVEVTFTQSGGVVTISSVGDLLVYLPTAPCVDVRNYDIVAGNLTGIDTLAATGGAGDDRITIESPLKSTLCAGPGNDALTGGAGDDVIAGAAGNDSLSGGPGIDILRADRIHNSAEALCTETPGSLPGANTLEGGPGDDLLVGGDGSDILGGGSGDDYAFARAGDDRVSGAAGDDALVGLDGADTIDGGPGLDVLSGGLGRDHMLGGEGKDDLGLPMLLTVDRGGPVETSLEFGEDRMEGGAGDDTLFAGAGDRTLNYPPELFQRAGGRRQPNGADFLSGGAGTDHVSYVNREIPVSVSLDGRPGDGSAGEGDNVASDVERITGGTADDVLAGGPQNDVIAGGPGSDRLGGLDGADTLEGGATDGGIDVLAGGPGPDSLSGGPGGDGLAGGAGDDSLQAGGGGDRIDGEAGADDLQGGADGDTLAGGAGADVLDGGPGADRADYADATGAVIVTLDGMQNDGARREDWVRLVENVRGGTGADSLFGNAGPNAIEGGPGDDLIDPAAGRDDVSAGRGRDAILARDEVRDAIACGGSRDVAVADGLDALGIRAERCERTDRGGGARRGEALLRPACRMDVRVPGSRRTLPLMQTLSIPSGTQVAADRCAAKLSARGRKPHVRVNGGAFILRRADTRRKALGLALAGAPFSTCRGEPASRRVRVLSVHTTGSLRLAARYAVSAGLRAAWTVEDRCGSTLTRVKRGKVGVTDRGRRRVVVVRAPGGHVSKPPGSGGR